MRLIIIMLCIHIITNFAAAQEPAPAAVDPHIKALRLNYAAIAVQEIIASGDRAVLEREYNSIISPLWFAEDGVTGPLLNALDTVSDMRPSSTERGYLLYAIYDGRTQVFINAIQDIRPDADVNALLMHAAVSMANTQSGYKKAEEAFGKEVDAAIWKLSADELAKLEQLKQDLLRASGEIPENDRVTDENLAAYIAAMKEPDPAKALAGYESLKTRLGSYPPFMFRYGEAARKAGDKERAMACFKELHGANLALMARDGWITRAALSELLLLDTSKESPEAREILESLSRHDNMKDWHIRLVRAAIHHAWGEEDAARSILGIYIEGTFGSEIHRRILSNMDAGKSLLEGIPVVARIKALSIQASLGNAEAFTELSDNTDAYAMGCLGNIYNYGLGAAQDTNKAMEWYRHAAEKGYAKGQLMLGSIYASGTGMTRNDTEASKWINIAAEQGDADAQQYLGLMYHNGYGVPQKYEEAIKWFRLAANQGHPVAQCYLGTKYEDGEGIPQSIEEAAKWYFLSAEQGYAHAQFNLGVLYDNGLGVLHNEEKASKLYRLAADQGFSDAQYRIGLDYNIGEYVVQSDIRAVMWYRLAAEQGNAKSQDALGNMYRRGKGVPKNTDEAEKWYKLAAEQWYFWGMWDLGRLYEEEDRDDYTEWYQKALSQAKKVEDGFTTGVTWGILLHDIWVKNTSNTPAPLRVFHAVVTSREDGSPILDYYRFTPPLNPGETHTFNRCITKLWANDNACAVTLSVYDIP